MKRPGQTQRFREIRQTSHYPEVKRPVVAMAKMFPRGSRTGRHSHERAQLLHAIEGLMAAYTDGGTWMVPPGYALWLPPGTTHDVFMHGDVAMRTAYVCAIATNTESAACRVIEVTPLLQACLSALAHEPAAYDENGRGGHLAGIILDEIARAPATPFALPRPRDCRVAKLADAVISDPRNTKTLDDLAREFAISRRNLTRLFREETGLSFGEWRRRLRLLVALARYADGESLTCIANKLGYGSVTAFRAMARREMPELASLFGAD